ncbi:MAG: RHS repeat-associated core domain-containing protein [Bacteroidetes bacterium]|nr:RHS repeat-associated core domain-containing protein [Bacteroidota bacterium]
MLRLLYEKTEWDGLNRPIKATHGGTGFLSTTSYAYGLQTSITSPGQDYHLTWDFATANILQREDQQKGVFEQFTYDGSYRLTSSTLGYIAGPWGTPHTTTYSANGNIMSKYDVGTYEYGSSKPNAVSYVTNVSGLVPTATQQITYTPFLRPKAVTENGWEQEFIYDHSYGRVQSILKQAGVPVETHSYLPEGLQIDSSTSGVDNIYYIQGPDGLCAIYKEHGGTSDWYIPSLDHIGSIVALADYNGHVVYEQSFDAWGRYRNPADWSFVNIPASTGFEWLRGYTGHEHMPQFGLINMNARLYDPLIGRMLGPDINVNGGGTQGYNRYTYANNNPLKYTDPDGNNPLIGAAIAAAVYTVGAATKTGGLGRNWNVEHFLINTFMGAWTGGMGGAVGDFFQAGTGIFSSGNIWVNEGLRGLAHGSVGFLSSGGGAKCLLRRCI